VHAHHAMDRRLFAWLAMARGHGPGPRRGRHGPSPYGRHGYGMPRGSRARRGDVRTAILVLLAEEPRNGYQLMQEIERRSDGAWRPSPGSVYPALQQLEDEGLVRTEGEEGRRAYALTDAGRTLVAERGDDEPAPWDAARDDPRAPQRELMGQVRQIAMALVQVSQTGSAAQVEEAKRILAETRRSLYRMLADEPEEEDRQEG
jgi:DNA-binding PadR family transcriptional regulator